MRIINEISEELKSKIIQLISTPGLEIEDIAKIVNLEQDIIVEILTNEYCKYDLDQGRRLCCKF